MSRTMEFWNVQSRSSLVVAEFANTPMDYFVDAAVEELSAIVDGAIQDEARGLVLCGRTRGRFITHFSPYEILEGMRDPQELARKGPVRNDQVNSLLNRITAAPFPVIAAMNGDTMGFGYELALACDLRIGQHGDYRYGLPEVRFGIVPGSGGMQRLRRLIGADRAMSLILRGKVVTPEDALELGMITELVEDAVSHSIGILSDVTRNSETAVKAAKRSIQSGVDTPLSQALDFDSAASLRAKLGPHASSPMEQYVALPERERRDYLDSSEVANAEKGSYS